MNNFNSNGSKDKVIQSLKELLDWYKYEATAEEMDFQLINAMCQLIDEVDPSTQARRKRERLKNTIVLNPQGRQGNVLFFVDPEDLS